MEIDIQAVGDRIRSARNNMGLKQSDFAKLIDATTPAVSNWENGRNLPNNERLKKIAELGNLTVDYLLYGHFFDLVFNSDNKYIPEQYHHVSGFTPVSVMWEANEYITKNNIYLSDKKKINEVIVHMMEKTLENINDQSEQQIAYIIKNLNTEEMYEKFDRFLQRDFPAFFENFKSSKDYVTKLKDISTFDEILENYNFIEDFFSSLRVVAEDLFYIEEMNTVEVNLNDFFKNEFTIPKQDSEFYTVGIKFSSTSPKITNLDKINTISIYDDMLSQHVYIIPNYKNSYQKPFQYQHVHFVIYDSVIHTSILRSDDTLEINNQFVHMNDVEFIAPLLSIIF